MNRALHIYVNNEVLAEGLADWIAADISLTLKSRKRYSFVLSGGNTPKALYKVLSARYKNLADWQRVDFFWGDERYVPFDDERNNGRMAFETLLTPLGIRPENIFRIETSPTPVEAAKKYNKTVFDYLGGADDFSFNLTLLGMGDDGHTLSVFPGSELAGNESDKITHTINKNTNLPRITMMPALVNRSHNIVFMLSGTGKAATLKEVMTGAYHPHQTPAQLIRPTKGNLHWFMDEAAAGEIMEL